MSNESMTWEVEAVEEMLRESRRLKLRPYQRSIFEDHTSGVVVLHWSRQIGKSHTLAAWAVWRLITRPGRLVTVLSNSRDNGAEFLRKCAEFCRAFEGGGFVSEEKARAARIRDTRMELRIRVWGMEGRIKVLAANPRTARGFSGDLILDEFAFHEDSTAIWEAAEPILASHPDYLCRIASTGNGRHNMFYKMVEGEEIKKEKLKIKNGAAGANIEHPTSNAEHRIRDGEAPLSGPLPTTASRGEGGGPEPASGSSKIQGPSSREASNSKTQNIEHRTLNIELGGMKAKGTRQKWGKLKVKEHLSPALSPRLRRAERETVADASGCIERAGGVSGVGIGVDTDMNASAFTIYDIRFTSGSRSPNDQA